MERLRRALRGVDRAERPALPVGEALHPVALLAVIALLVNDWVLKAWIPGALTGKLSDLAGLAFAPVALTAAIGLVLHAAARLGARLDPSLSRRRLLLAIAATGAGFALVKLSPAAAGAVAHALSLLGRPASIALDRTDLLTLPALGVAWWIGRDELRRVPLGRPAAIHRLGRPAAPALADTGAAPALVAAIEAWDVGKVDVLLSGR